MTNTPFMTSLGTKESFDAVLAKQSALGRMAEPDEITRVILFLLSDEASYMTGSVCPTQLDLH